MKIEVYQEHYKTKTPYHEPGKVVNEQWAKTVKGVGDLLTGAIEAKMEKDDAADMARLEADTRLAAEQMQKEFRKTANPDDYEGDVTRQKEAIQTLIKDQSKKLRLAKNQSDFYSRMTKSVEPAYMGETLKYSWELQHQTAIKNFESSNDAIIAMLATGSSMMPLADAVELTRRNYDNTTQAYGIDKLVAENEFDTNAMPKLVTTWATAMTDQDPQLVMDTLMGSGISGFMAAKEAMGQPITIQQFLEDDALRDEYSKSEYAAQFVDYFHYLPYPTRQALYDRASLQLERQKKEREAAAFAENAFSADTNAKMLEAEKNYIKEYGTVSNNYGTPHVIDGTIDPALSINGGKIKMGKATPEGISKGNFVGKVGQSFADGIAGGLTPRGIVTKITSDNRPGDSSSKHKNDNATDLKFVKTGQTKMSMATAIAGYKEAITKYGAHIPKKGVLFEIRTNQLPEADQVACKNANLDCLDYMKKSMEAQGIDTSWIDWANSKKYRDAEKWSGNHIHFTRSKSANYSQYGTAGDKQSFTVNSDIAFNVYKQKRADGKSPKDAYEAAHKVDVELMASWNAERTIRNIIVSKGANGKVVDPATYEAELDKLRAKTQKDVNSGKLSPEEFYIQMEAYAAAKDRLPEYLETYQKDPVKFVKQAYKNVSTNEQAAAILANQYGMDAVNIRTMTNAEAETMADQLMNKLQGIEAINKMASIKSEADLRQISSKLTGPKGDILLWSGSASDKMKQEMAAAINTENWKAIELKMTQDKNMFPSSWKTTFQKKLNANSFFKKFVSDYETTQPGHTARLYDAMINMYAYEKVLGHMADKSDTEIANYLVREMLGASFTSVSVRSPREGATDLNISRSVPGISGHEKDVQKVINVALEMGVDDKQTYVVHGPQGATEFSVIKAAANDKTGAATTRERGSVRRNTTLVSTSNGTGAKFYWKDPNNMQGPTPILRTNDVQPATIPYDKALSLDKAVKSEMIKYKMSDGSYAQIQKVNGQTFTMYVNYDSMYKALARKKLAEEFPWLHRALVSDKPFIVPKNHYRKGTDTNIDVMMNSGMLDEQGAEAMWNQVQKIRGRK